MGEGGCAVGGGGRWVRWRGKREITVRESENEKEKAHEIPVSVRLRGKKIWGNFVRGKE